MCNQKGLPQSRQALWESDLPWPTWAIMLKFRMFDRFVIYGNPPLASPRQARSAGPARSAVNFNQEWSPTKSKILWGEDCARRRVSRPTAHRAALRPRYARKWTQLSPSSGSEVIRTLRRKVRAASRCGPSLHAPLFTLPRCSHSRSLPQIPAERPVSPRSSPASADGPSEPSPWTSSRSPAPPHGCGPRNCPGP